MYVCMYVYTVDQEIYTIKNFSPVAYVAKIKRAKIKYMYMRYIAEPLGGEIFSTQKFKHELFLPRKFPYLQYLCV